MAEEERAWTWAMCSQWFFFMGVSHEFVASNKKLLKFLHWLHQKDIWRSFSVHLFKIILENMAKLRSKSSTRRENIFVTSGRPQTPTLKPCKLCVLLWRGFSGPVWKVSVIPCRIAKAGELTLIWGHGSCRCSHLFLGVSFSYPGIERKWLLGLILLRNQQNV